jgi:hypothetical protein
MYNFRHVPSKASLPTWQLFDPDDGGSTSFRNICELLQEYTASCPRRYVLFIVGCDVKTSNPTTLK